MEQLKYAEHDVAETRKFNELLLDQRSALQKDNQELADQNARLLVHEVDLTKRIEFLSMPSVVANPAKIKKGKLKTPRYA